MSKPTMLELAIKEWGVARDALIDMYTAIYLKRSFDRNFVAAVRKSYDVNLICNRIHSEIDELGLVILVFDVGTTQETRLSVKKEISDFVRCITYKKFQIGVVKEMALEEFVSRQKKHGIPIYRY